MKSLLLFILLSPVLCLGQMESGCADKFFFTPSLGAFVTHELKPGINVELGLIKWDATWYCTVSGNMVSQPDSADYEIGVKFYRRLTNNNKYEWREVSKNHFEIFFSNRYTTKTLFDKQGMEMPRWLYGGGISYNIRLNKEDVYHVEFMSIYAEYTHHMSMGGFRVGVNLGGIL